MTDTKTTAVRVCVVDDQEIYGLVYQTVFESVGGFELLSVETSRPQFDLFSSVSSHRPDVLVRGVRDFDQGACEELGKVKDNFPALGLVVLPVFIGAEGGKQLQRFLRQCRTGLAVYLRHSMDSAEQICKMVTSAAHGQVILDPAIAGLMLTQREEPPFLKLLTSREMEIIGLLSQGHTNAAIAEDLFIDVKTVEHHLNSIYSKMKSESDWHGKHPRVSAARMYLGLNRITPATK